MSFGGVVIDNLGYTDALPGRSLLTGMIANALGYDRTDGAVLEALQSRIEYAARQEVAGESLVDYQTADLSLPWMTEGWTTRGALVTRIGGAAARTGTHIRYRHFIADGVVTVALHLAPGDPTLEAVGKALQKPARPLFIGRKPCIPSRPIFDGFIEESTLRRALERIPLLCTSRDAPAAPRLARWPRSGPSVVGSRVVTAHEDRDWVNQVHMGSRELVEGTVVVEATQ